MTDPQTPATEAGRRLMTVLGVSAHWAADIIAIEAEARASLDVDRLADILTARMPDGCYWMRDDGTQFDIVSPTTVAAMIVHAYLTGDVLSGTPAILAETER